LVAFLEVELIARERAPASESDSERDNGLTALQAALITALLRCKLLRARGTPESPGDADTEQKAQKC
jgi:hypothetical protein